MLYEKSTQMTSNSKQTKKTQKRERQQTSFLKEYVADLDKFVLNIIMTTNEACMKFNFEGPSSAARILSIVLLVCTFQSTLKMNIFFQTCSWHQHQILQIEAANKDKNITFIQFFLNLLQRQILRTTVSETIAFHRSYF